MQKWVLCLSVWPASQLAKSQASKSKPIYCEYRFWNRRLISNSNLIPYFKFLMCLGPHQKSIHSIEKITSLKIKDHAFFSCLLAKREKKYAKEKHNLWNGILISFYQKVGFLTVYSIWIRPFFDEARALWTMVPNIIYMIFFSLSKITIKNIWFKWKKDKHLFFEETKKKTLSIWACMIIRFLSLCSLTYKHTRTSHFFSTRFAFGIRFYSDV